VVRPAQARSIASRQAILDAALPFFVRDGFTAASLNQMIAASGMTKGAFYFHFPSKEALALAVLAQARERGAAALAAEIGHPPTAWDRIWARPRAMVRLGVLGGPGALSKVVEELARDPDLRDEVCGPIWNDIDVVTQEFQEAQAEGTVRADLDARELAELAVGAFIGMVTLTAQTHDEALGRRVEVLIATVQRAVAATRED
jgi:TetR/AcrR family transcriptional repressor of nem operon